MKTFCTNSVRLCEKKDNAGTSIDSQTKLPEQKEEQRVLKTEDRGTADRQTDDNSKQLLAKSQQPKVDTGKSEKENLLDLLGAMKVEVTNKRKLKTMKRQQSIESAAQYKSKPADMESTISMFQKATEEASSQRYEKSQKPFPLVTYTYYFLPDTYFTFVPAYKRLCWSIFQIKIM